MEYDKKFEGIDGPYKKDNFFKKIWGLFGYIKDKSIELTNQREIDILKKHFSNITRNNNFFAYSYKGLLILSGIKLELKNLDLISSNSSIEDNFYILNKTGEYLKSGSELIIPLTGNKFDESIIKEFIKKSKLNGLDIINNTPLLTEKYIKEIYSKLEKIPGFNRKNIYNENNFDLLYSNMINLKDNEMLLIFTDEMFKENIGYDLNTGEKFIRNFSFAEKMENGMFFGRHLDLGNIFGNDKYYAGVINKDILNNKVFTIDEIIDIKNKSQEYDDFVSNLLKDLSIVKELSNNLNDITKEIFNYGLIKESDKKIFNLIKELNSIIEMNQNNSLILKVKKYSIGPGNGGTYLGEEILNSNKIGNTMRDKLQKYGEYTSVAGINPVHWSGTIYKLI